MYFHLFSYGRTFRKYGDEPCPGFGPNTTGASRAAGIPARETAGPGSDGIRGRNLRIIFFIWWKGSFDYAQILKTAILGENYVFRNILVFIVQSDGCIFITFTLIVCENKTSLAKNEQYWRSGLYHT